MRLTREQLRTFFKPAYFQRGEAYFRNGRVSGLDVPDAQQITATIKGSGNNLYHAQISLSEEDGQLVDIDGYCSCPVSYNCKHVVATMLAYQQRSKPRQDDLFGMPSDRWLYKLKAVKAGSSSPDRSSELLLYLLYMNHYSTGHYLKARVLKTRQRKDGSYAEPRFHSGNPHSHARYMQEDDKFALLVLHSLKSEGAGDSALEEKSGAKALQVLIDTGRCHWMDEKGPPLRHANRLQTVLSWHFRDDASQVITAANLDHSFVLLPLVPPYYLNVQTGDCGLLDCGLPHRVAAVLLASPPVPPEDVDKVSRFVRGLGYTDMPLPTRPKFRDLQGIEPEPRLHLVNEQDDFSSPQGDEHEGIALLSFYYDGSRVHPFDDRGHLMRRRGNSFERIRRDLPFERRIIDQLDAIGLIHDGFHDDPERGLRLEPVHAVNTWLDFMIQHRSELEAAGWCIEASDDFVFNLDQADSWYGDIDDSTRNWFTLELGVEVDGETVNLLPFLVNYLDSLRRAQKLDELRELPDDHPLLLRRENGRLLHIQLAKVRHIIDTLVELYEPDSLDSRGRLELSRLNSRQLIELEAIDDNVTWQGGQVERELAQRLRDFDGIRPVEPPEALRTELREYQREGLNWLQFLREFELGGILADDMGLGKTVQALAHILVEKAAGRHDLPSLVVAPTSLMVNWQREAARFAPGLQVLVLQGVDRRRYFSSIASSDIVLTTYPLLSRDTEVLLNQAWHLVILDEAQHIKNPRSKAAQTARQLQARHRLCLTGTPLENHLGELWSQFHFLMPGLLGNEKRFRKLFRLPIEKRRDESRQQQLRNRVAPFLLRRDKSTVASELPPKSEIISEVELDGAQRDLYETIRVAMHEKVTAAIDSKGIERSRILILDALLKLRQVCCHPQLLKMDSAKKVKQSAKLNQLLEMLPEMVAEGRRILLFSQFTSMLAIIEQELVRIGIDYVKLTGQTKNRARPVDDFQSGSVPLFLISLKAGGSGLNLTAADTVIHYDPWWNPAVENQATDRAHRIGQDKPVFVYKLITSGTVEERIVEMQHRKQAMADVLFSEASRDGKISIEDLQGLFEPLA